MASRSDHQRARDSLASSCLFAEKSQEAEIECQCRSNGINLPLHDVWKSDHCRVLDSYDALTRCGTLHQVARHESDTQQLLDSASHDGTRTVFNEYMCGLIRRVTVQTLDSTTSRLSITATSSTSRPADLVLSLDIYDWGIEKLAMALFDAKMTSVQQGTHISLYNGTTLTVPDSEVTLRGANNGAIVATFGWEIYHAINGNSIRNKEREEGKDTTECISMMILNTGAIINLCLGLNQGLAIIRKLHS
ncbi:hypothetical protein BKA64DRAFT_713302 [Cadophora sp. MPI-SDFR-AT-0126]|nr:hypothetical protein BKA64DRAFT_713302 [Leotiomycetes sp. MPI-SDFR-AT-0126]